MNNFTNDKKKEDVDFEKKMKKIVSNARQIREDFYYRRFIKRCTLLISSIFFLSLVTEKNIYAIHVPRFEYFIQYCNQYDELSLISTVEAQGNRDKILRYHIPAEIPKGYKRKKVRFIHDACETIYQKKGENQLVYYQYTDHQKSRIDTKKSPEYEKKMYQGNYYYIRTKDKLNSIVWYFNEYQYQLIGSEPISCLLKMAESLI